EFHDYRLRIIFFVPIIYYAASFTYIIAAFFCVCFRYKKILYFNIISFLAFIFISYYVIKMLQAD
ncbi:MAG: hypothetical protein LBB59_04310, partial [Campylobacteraceae bacterium]|nr:hypothetical protein [Campylobacteraceae bacterium]